MIRNDEEKRQDIIGQNGNDGEHYKDLRKIWDDYNSKDNVNNPSHYKSHPSGIECIQVTEHMDFCLGNAVKYIWRAFLKDNPKEDLEKARWYINRKISQLD